MFLIGLVLIVISYLVIVFVFLLVSLLFSMSHPNRSKLSPYECGFSPVNFIQSSFSVHFFTLMLVFVVFDLEIVFLLGFVYSGSNSILMFLSFWSLVMLSYYLEKWTSAFKWRN